MKKAVLFFAAALFTIAGAAAQKSSADVYPQLWHGRVNAVALSPGGDWAASGTVDGEIAVYDAESGREFRLLLAGPESAAIQALVFAQTKPVSMLISIDADGVLWGWDFTGGKNLYSVKTGIKAASLSVSPDGGTILGFDGGALKTWDAKTGKERFSLPLKNIRAAGYAPGGKNITAVTSQGDSAWDAAALKTLDASTGKELRSVAWNPPVFQSAALSPDTKYLATGASSQLRLWDTAAGKPLYQVQLRYTVESLAFSPSGKYIAVTTDSSVTFVFDAATGEEIVYLAPAWGYEWGNACVTFSADERYVVTEAGNGYGINFWEWNTDSGVEMLNNSNTALTTNERYFAVKIKQENGKTVSYKTWYVEDEGELRTFSGHGSGVIKLEWNPEGTQLASYGSSQAVIWDFASGRKLSQSSLETNAYLRFSGLQQVTSADGSYTAVPLEEDDGYAIHRSSKTSAADYYAKKYGLVDVQVDGEDSYIEIDEKPLYTLKTGNPVVFSPNNTLIAGIDTENFTTVWETATGKILARFIFYNDGEWIVITPEGYYNASPGGDRYLNVRIENKVFGIDQFRHIFYRPDLAAMVLSGRRDAYTREIKNTVVQNAAAYLPPEITIKSPAGPGQGNPSAGSPGTPDKASRGIAPAGEPDSPGTKTYRLSVEVSGKNQPLQAIQVLVNGRRLGRDALAALSGSRSLKTENAEIRISGNTRTVEFVLPVDLEPGRNRIEVIASNGSAETRKRVDVYYEASVEETAALPNLWVLAIGVNNYNDSSVPDLKYCVNDAQELIETFQRQEGKRYAKVNALLLADGVRAPTAKNIRESFSFLSGASSKDMVLLFIAGHGVSGDDRIFYYLPQDAAFAQDGSLRKDRAISSMEILSVLNSGGNRLVFIDACYSGGLSGKTGSVDNDVLIRSLQDSNAFVFSSSRGTELSQELARYQHGVFTYTLIQGLNGAAGATGRKQVSILELDAYVSREVKNITNDSQHPSHSALGFVDFDVTVK
jgi:WD40 repeat protein